MFSENILLSQDWMTHCYSLAIKCRDAKRHLWATLLHFLIQEVNYKLRVIRNGLLWIISMLAALTSGHLNTSCISHIFASCLQTATCLLLRTFHAVCQDLRVATLNISTNL